MSQAWRLDTSRAQAAGILVASRLSGALLDCLPGRVAPHDEVEAYHVQSAAHALLGSAGFGRQAGWKIGCTTPVMQEYLGIRNPCAGAMFQAHVWYGRHNFEVRQPRRLGVECEIGVRMGRDLPLRESAYQIADVADAVAACMAAIEVVEDRYADYPALEAPTLIADDFFHYSCVLGPQDEQFEPAKLREVTSAMTINGKPSGSGRGSDIMGEPLAVLAWLANNCVSRGTPLKAGDIVLLGSLVQTNWIGPDDAVAVANDPLGEVTANFTAA
jgi:2-oxo-3-hexenedioate decarboxylase/2-keto-4-pentenoate hydratase